MNGWGDMALRIYLRCQIEEAFVRHSLPKDHPAIIDILRFTHTLCVRDSGSDPNGENAGTAVECEASQSGAESASPEPSTLSIPARETVL